MGPPEEEICEDGVGRRRVDPEPGDNGIGERVEVTDLGDESARWGCNCRGRRENEGLEIGRREGDEEGLEERERRRSDEEGDGEMVVMVGE